MIDLPDLGHELEWTIPATPAQRNASAWTGRSKVVQLPGMAAWRATLRFDPIATEVDERLLRAFIASCDGMMGVIRAPYLCQNHIGPRPTVRAVGTAGTLPLGGMQRQTRILDAGQAMTVPLPSGRHRLVILTADLVTDGLGRGTATFAPRLNETPAIGATVETNDPFAPMRFAQADTDVIMQQGISGASIALVEAL